MDKAVADPQLLAQTLKFGVHADEEAVHGVGVEHAVRVGRQPGDDPGRALVPARTELLDHLGTPDRKPVAAVWIDRRDQVGNL